ncbi:MAG: branched-chain amino acid ABC transporter permease [Deltaproteobacteria bacterium]|nr:branched-chain amino acid ABC transporter permease [Deltaproteobacteria bacterium]
MYFKRTITLGALIILLFILPVFLNGPYILHLCILLAINIILSTSLRLISLTGQISLAHGGMVTIGAYTSAILVMKLGVSSWVALIVAGLAAAASACLIGFPFVRLKGIYFCMVTVFLGQIVTLAIQEWKSITGGTQGIFDIPPPDPVNLLGFISITFDNRVPFYYLILIIMIISLLLLYAIEHSRTGFIFRGIEQSDSLTESVGIFTLGYKVLSFSIGCFFAGLTGGFYSQYVSTIHPNTFGFIFTVYTLVYMVVGGSKNFYGPIIGSLVLGLIPEVLRPLKTYQPFFFAGVLLLIIFFMPEGLVGLPEWIRLKSSKISRNKTRHARD